MNITRKFDWFSLIVGVGLIFSGIASLKHPTFTLEFVSILAGFVSILKGIYELWFRRLFNFSGWRGALTVIIAALDIVFGLVFIFNHAAGILFIAYLFAFWFIMDSFFGLQASTFLDKSRLFVSIVLNILGIILGIILLFNPLLSASTIVLIVSFNLIFFGVIKIIQAF